MHTGRPDLQLPSRVQHGRTASDESCMQHATRWRGPSGLLHRPLQRLAEPRQPKRSLGAHASSLFPAAG